MIRYFLKSVGAQVRSGRTLFLLAVTGVALGVASVLSIQVVNLNALGAFEGSAKAVSGDADFSVVPLSPALPETLYPRVIADDAIEAAWPIVRLHVALRGQEDFYLEVLGVDFFSPMRLPRSAEPAGSGDPVGTRGWAAVSPVLAERFGWAPGDRFEVSSGARVVELRVGSLIDFRRYSPAASSRMVVMDIAQVQHLFGIHGRVDQIDVRLRRDADAQAARERLERALGPAVRVRTPEQRRARTAGLLQAFRLNLTALSLVSLFVGAFLVYTSTRAALTRRRNEFGLLRSIGTTRGQMFALIVAEVALLGLLGVLLGLPLGYWVAERNVEVVSKTLSNIYLLEEIERLVLPPWMFALAGLIGIGGALLGAIGPAVELSRRDTRSLLAAYALHERTVRWSSPMFVVGWVMVLGGWVVWASFLQGFRPGGFVVGLGLLFGLPLLAPWTIQRVTGSMSPRRFGLAYGVKALGLKLQPSAFAVAALAVAVTMLVGITLMIGSFRRTVEIWIGSTLQADVYVTTESWARARASATLEPGFVEELQARDDVRVVDRLRQFFGYTGDRRISLVAVDMSIPAARGRFELLEGELDDALVRAANDGAVIISEPLARKTGLGPGDRLPLVTPAGEVELPVAGISYDYSNEAGGAAMDLSTMTRLFGAGPINNVALYLEPGVDPDRAIDDLRARYGELPLEIRSNADIRREVFRIFDQTFAVTRLLQVMSLLIAACGITLTLIVLARERISELALYRALGATRAQIFRVFLGKGLGIALFGSALGSVGGVALAMILIFIINRAYFGWTIAVHWPVVALADELATILLAALLASVYPAVRASRTPAMELTRENL